MKEEDKKMLKKLVVDLQWDKQTTTEANNNKNENDRKEGEQWDEGGVIVMYINTAIYNNKIENKETISSKDPTQSNTYKLRQAIISALLKYLQSKSDIRNRVSSQRIQYFIINKIQQAKKIPNDTIWVSGMEKRERQVIAQADDKTQCVMIQFR